jgi:hypothetical protein
LCGHGQKWERQRKEEEAFLNRFFTVAESAFAFARCFELLHLFCYDRDLKKVKKLMKKLRSSSSESETDSSSSPSQNASRQYIEHDDNPSTHMVRMPRLFD